LCLLDDDAFEVDFLGFDSALGFSGDSLGSIGIDKVFGAYGIEDSEGFRDFLDAFFSRQNGLKVPYTNK
jgi:hypothetical protein